MGLIPEQTAGAPRLLLDTHALVWWWTADRRLSAAARTAIADRAHLVAVSAASGWEIATKRRRGKWAEVAPLVDGFDDLLPRSRFASLPILTADAGNMRQDRHRSARHRFFAARSGKGEKRGRPRA